MSPLRYGSLVSLLIVLLVFGCKAKPERANDGGQKISPVPVRAMTAEENAVARQGEVAGTVEAVQSATIAAKVVGVITEMPVAIGVSVKKGDLLARVSVAESSARLAQATAQLDQAKRNLEREQRLLAKEAATPEAVKTLEESYRVAEAAHREAKAIQGYSTITAPFSGQVSGKMVKAGDLATVGLPLLVLTDNERLQVVAAVPEAVMPQLKKGDALSVQVPAAQFEGRGIVAELSPSADHIARSSIVKLTISGPEALRPGQYARVGLPGSTATTVMVPVSAVSRSGQMERIFVVRNGAASLRLVRTGEQLADRVEVLSGLAAGEQVIVEGAEELVDGQPVTVELQ